MAKKKAAKKKATKKKVTRKKTARRSPAPKPPATTPAKEVDPKSLEGDEAKKRVAAIYKLEKVVEAKKALEAVAKSGAKAATAARKEAEDALEQEIREQRFGPGPLFNETGTGPA